MRIGWDEHKRKYWKENDTFLQNSGRNPSREEKICAWMKKLRVMR
jgi:hypothetical protein